MWLTGNFEIKIQKKIRKFFSHFLVFWELLLSPVVEKVVFESFWALDMAPTWAVPGLFHFVATESQFLNVFKNIRLKKSQPALKQLAINTIFKILNLISWFNSIFSPSFVEHARTFYMYFNVASNFYYDNLNTLRNFNALVFPCCRQLLSSCSKESSNF